MRKSLLDHLRCLKCSASNWKLDIASEDEHEIREGSVTCSACGEVSKVHEGILDMIGEDLPP